MLLEEEKKTLGEKIDERCNCKHVYLEVRHTVFSFSGVFRYIFLEKKQFRGYCNIQNLLWVLHGSNGSWIELFGINNTG